MSFSRDVHNNINFYCDACREEYLADATDFKLAWEMASEEGWTTRREAVGQWKHACPDCDIDLI
jgi:hypothetical protein